DPLDASAVRPEAYPVVRRISQATGCDVRALIGNRKVLATLRPADFVDERFGLPTVTDILAELDKPGRDPRPTLRTAAFAEGVETLADPRPGMVLEGVVTNVTAFGAFVDIGVHQDGLVHISQMSDRYVEDPREVVRPGDVVRVKVLDVDVARSRISLTLRLDEPVGAAGAGGRPGRGGRGSGGRPGGDRPGSGASGGRGRPGPPRLPATALADALRRAGLAGGTGSR